MTTVPPMLDFSADLHVEARTVLSRSRDPQDRTEIAAVLETCGYTDEAARHLGRPTVFALADDVNEAIDLFVLPPGTAEPAAVGEPADDDDERLPRRPEPERIGWRLFVTSSLNSIPWLVALVALAVTKLSFWSSLTSAVSTASMVSAALFSALVLTGVVIYAFSRRAWFFAGQGDAAQLRRVTLTMLAGGFALIVIFYVATFVGFTAAGAYTAEARWAYVLFGPSISLLLLTLAPLFAGRSFGWMTAAAASGAAVLVGSVYVAADVMSAAGVPESAAQLGAILVVCAVAVAGIPRSLRRMLWGTPPSTGGALGRPRRRAVARSLLPYAVYGGAFYALIVVDQFVAGGLWQGRFVYRSDYAIGSGVALLLLIPVLTFTVAFGEVVPHRMRRIAESFALRDIAGARAVMRRFFRRHAAVVVALGWGGLLLIVGAVMALRAGWFPPVAVDFDDSVMMVVLVAGGGYVAFGWGALNAVLLLAFARPGWAAWGAAAGAAVSAVSGWALTGPLPAPLAAAAGLSCGATVFVMVTAVGAAHVVRHFDAFMFAVM